MLNVHSQYSLRYGILSTQEIIRLMKHSGYPDFVLTDINSTTAAIGLVREAEEAGCIARAGVDFRNGIEQKFVSLAKNNNGFMELNEYLSDHLHTDAPFPDIAPKWKDCITIYPWKSCPEKLGDNEWAGISVRDLNKLKLSKELPDHLGRTVILQPMTFNSKRHFNMHRILRAIHLNTLLSMLPASEHAGMQDSFISYGELTDTFRDYPQIIENTHRLLEECSVHFDLGENAGCQNISTYTGSRAGDLTRIRELVAEGLALRYPGYGKEIAERVEKEISVIDQKDYLSYFLVAHHIVSYARGRGYFYVGRGSGANSIVAYLLRITDVDPMELDLYFERFINLFRKNPPDFDMDFSWKDREDITAHIFERFPNAALLATYATFQFRAAVREIGKVMGLPASEISLLAEGKKRYEELDHISQLVVSYSRYIDGLPSHFSIHAGGIVISEKPIHWFGATHMPPKGYRTVQFSMLEAEDAGLYKFDILSQRGLAKIEECLRLAADNRPDRPVHDIHDMAYLKNDEGIKRLLSCGKALGCFYVESPGMRMLLLKLKVDNYLTLVAASSIIRPGVAQSGMMRQYILRHLDASKRNEAHPEMRRIMPETYGVMVYQEDVIKVAHEFAGLNLAEADVLRRGMSGKFRSRKEFQAVQEKFFYNCAARGHSQDDISEIWRQIESFAGYSFSKGHSASYAVESYQSLYLKCYYPLEYMVATINNGGGFYATEFYMREARMLGGTIEAPSVNYGSAETTIRGDVIWLGMLMINGIESKIVTDILIDRNRRGRFDDFHELLERVHIPLEQLMLLIKAGCLRDICSCKKTLLWKAHFYHSKRKPEQAGGLFDTPPVDFELPELTRAPMEDAFDELSLLGFTLGNPFDLLPADYERPSLSAADIPVHCGTTIDILGYLVHVKRSSTSKGGYIYFGTFLDVNGEHFDTIVFGGRADYSPYRERGIYRISGTVTEEFGFYTIETAGVKRVPYREDERYADERSAKRLI
jgi:DNA-directed DNA polymerase III PolC